jgi:glyoxylase-like metal-dependent hydrolase (beta-lactamase superfamily II)
MDHQGSSHAVCEAFDIPLHCGAGDREAVETGDQRSISPKPDSRMAALMTAFAGPGHPVSSTLSDGDEIGGFQVIETPGHTPGHLAYWDEEEGVLILGDVLFHRNPATFRKGLTEPFGFATFDPALNRDSARKLAALGPSTICFGHGAPLADGETFQRFVDTLPGG